MGDSEDLGPARRVFFVDERVRETIEVVDAQTVIQMRPELLVLSEQVPDSLVLGEECFGDSQAGVFRVVDRCVAQFCLGSRVKPVTHPRRARTRARASSPGTMDTMPLLASA